MGVFTAAPLKADTLDKVEPVSKTRIEPGLRDDKVIDEKDIVDNSQPLFREKELSLDVFGLYAFEAEDGAYGDSFGGGIGVNYFFNRYIGVGLEGYWFNGDDVVSSVSGNIIARYPIEAWHLAPYAIVGVGGNFDADNVEDQVNGSGGLGLEYRFTHNWSIFSDARYVVTERGNDYAVTRTGVRYSF